MTTIEALILGIIQGVTEFLPVSSSGHLELAQYFLGLQGLDKLILFDLVCHLGTLLAIFIVFSRDIQQTFTTQRTRLYQICLAILPLFPLLWMIKPIKDSFDRPDLLGFFFIITAGLLYAGIRFGRDKDPELRKESRWSDALVIGIFQACAIFPGVSRSGSTISGARLMGWTRREAVVFSFLLAIPTILGGTLIEGVKLYKGYDASVGVGYIQYLVGFIASFLMGIAALKALIKIVLEDQMMIFVWYCLGIGLFSLGYFS